MKKRSKCKKCGRIMNIPYGWADTCSICDEKEDEKRLKKMLKECMK